MDCGISLEDAMGVMVFTFRDDAKGFVPGNVVTTDFLLCLEHGNGKNTRKRSSLPKGDA
jgi:hypothetical protein